MNLEETIYEIEKADDNHLYILWTNADITAANLMVFMYAENSLKQKWWEQVTIIVWGATTKLAAENSMIQERIKDLQQEGVKFTACVTCAKELGVEEKIEGLGIDLIKWGIPLTKLIKLKKNLITV